MKKIFYNISRVFTLALIATISTIATSARASTWYSTDYLGSNSIGNWSCWATVESSSSRCIHYPGTHVFNERFSSPVSLTDSVQLKVGSGWSDLGRPVSITPYRPAGIFGPFFSCKAQMTVLPGVDYTTIAQLEVIDAASWTYVKTKRVEYRPPLIKSVIATPSWTASAKDIFVRIGLIGVEEPSWIYVDDIRVTCTY